MSVFTPVDRAALDPWLAGYDLGRALELKPIAEGVQNTNFFLDTERQRSVLTLFERVAADELPFYLNVMHRLALEGVSCPAPVLDRAGRFFSTLCGKPAAIVGRLNGRSIDKPTEAHCRAIGEWMARMHLALAHTDVPSLVNPRGRPWRRGTASAVRQFLGTAALDLLDAAMVMDQAAELPGGVIHADLFRDNALWRSDDPVALGGVIDFYFACVDTWIFDLAITANDWCQGGSPAELDPEKVAALLSGYHKVRPLLDAERRAWPEQLVIAGLRFWLSRLADKHLPLAGVMVMVKDPVEYEIIVRHRLALAQTPNNAPWFDR